MVEKFSKDDYKLWTKFRESTRSTLNNREFRLVCLLHSQYYRHKYHEPCTCSPKTIKQWIKDLNAVYNNGN
jgi:hypothetical protein